MQTTQRDSCDRMLSDTPTTTTTTTATRGEATFLRTQEAENERLLMDDFDHELRIECLEKQLRRAKEDVDFVNVEREVQVEQLRVALKEREHTLAAENEQLRMDNSDHELRIECLEKQLRRAKEDVDFVNVEREVQVEQLRVALKEREHTLAAENEQLCMDNSDHELRIECLEKQLRRAKEDVDFVNVEREVQVEQLRVALKEREHTLAAENEQLCMDNSDHELRIECLEKQLRRAKEDVDFVNVEREVQVEHQLQTQKDIVATLSNKLQELQDARTRDERETELMTQREQQNLQQMEMTHVKLLAEEAHWKALSKEREEQLATLQAQVETMKQEKQTQIAQYQDKLRRMEEQVQHRLGHLERERDTYHAERARLLAEKDSRQEPPRCSHDLKESNRLPVKEVLERRRHAREQYMQELRENKELQKTIDTFKGTFGGRYKDIKKYNAAVKRYGQQLQRGAEFSEVRQTLPEQLEQTQNTATETYKRNGTKRFLSTLSVTK
ncbi:uncharacterized protein KRP23_3338 [Phytophthora ramorum]|uniref:uncharacterized protein n=1 Tax=Phytophthora ramorum TaxID=164328 RepID=UPI00309C6573|nr:hypothetical protein KRP23_3338 [Phytophthora ramorum]